MSQSAATFSRVIRELMRDKILVFWSVFFPIIWLVMGNYVFLANAPEEQAVPVRGAFTISMLVYALMIAGMVDLPGNIASDRNRGMLLKLKSMPVSQFMDFLGRILAFLAFSLIAAGTVLLVGLLLGARLSATWITVLQCFGFLLLAALAASGIGLIIGTLVRGEQAALYTGIGLALVTGFTSGIFTLYSQLTPALQLFSRVYPISSANSSLIYLLVGEAAAGYNPTDPGQAALTAATSVTLFAVGLAAYSKYCWRMD